MRMREGWGCDQRCAGLSVFVTDGQAGRADGRTHGKGMEGQEDLDEERVRGRQSAADMDKLVMIVRQTAANVSP